MVGFGFVLALAGIILLIVGVAQAGLTRSYANCNETVYGTIIKKRSHSGKRGTSYELTVSYMVDGKSYERVVGALLTEFETMVEGDQVELRYKKGKPKRSVRPEALNPKLARVVLTLGAVLLVVGVALLFICKYIICGS